MTKIEAAITVLQGIAARDTYLTPFKGVELAQVLLGANPLQSPISWTYSLLQAAAVSVMLREHERLKAIELADIERRDPANNDSIDKDR